jgi:hypothetical protein
MTVALRVFASCLAAVVVAPDRGDRLTTRPIEAWRRAADTTSVSPWHGRLRIARDQRGFVDERGEWVLPIFAHFGEAFSAFVRRPADVERQLRAIKAAGYDGIRFWDTLGYHANAWRGKEVMPWAFTNDRGERVEATPSYYQRLSEFLLALRGAGLTAHHSRGDLNGIALERVVQHAEVVAALYDTIGWDINALFEGNNEDFQNGSFGPEGLRRIVEPASRRGALVASSCPGRCSEQESDLRKYTKGFSVFYVHGARPGTPSDRLRRIFTLGTEANRFGEARLGWQGEPIGPNERVGPGVTVAHTENVEELALLAGMSLVARQAWVYMSQCGVFWHCAIESQRGFTIVPRIRESLKAVAPDVMSWPLTHAGRDDALWCVPAGCGGPNHVTDSNRHALVYQAVHPELRRVVLLVHGGPKPRAIRNVMGCDADVTIARVEGAESIAARTVHVSAGADLALDYDIGQLLLAQCR